MQLTQRSFCFCWKTSDSSTTSVYSLFQNCYHKKYLKTLDIPSSCSLKERSYRICFMTYLSIVHKSQCLCINIYITLLNWFRKCALNNAFDRLCELTYFKLSFHSHRRGQRRFLCNFCTAKHPFLLFKDDILMTRMAKHGSWNHFCHIHGLVN